MNSTHGGTTSSAKSVGMTAWIIAYNALNAVIGYIINVLGFRKTSLNYIVPNFSIETTFVVRGVKCGLFLLVPLVVI